ncbi:MAG: carbohydrate kinase [Ignavibacteriae bacterium]|nr:carbohydrate kinase [Ignavibacteriota bacterium]
MKNITVAGEVLFDCYPSYKKLGGAPFNFAYHINKLVGKVNLISAVGNDDEGIEIINFMKQSGMDTNNIQINNYSTGLVNVNLNDEKIPSFEILENSAYDFIEFDAIKNSNDNELFYFGTLAQRNRTSRETIQRLLQNQSKVFYDVNLRQNYFNKEILLYSLNNAGIVKMNNEELEIILNLFQIEKSNLFEQKALKVKNHFGIDILIITLGKDGSILFGDKISYQNKKVNSVTDTVGAGDAYSAMFVAAMLKNKNLDLCNKFGVEFAADICQVEGAVPSDDKIYTTYLEKLNE